MNILSGSTSGDVVATLRQFENPSGTAHFDLQNILKNYTTPNPTLETTTGITDARYETFRFVGEVGIELGGTFSVNEYATGSTGSYCVIGGSKPYYDLNWDNQNQYIAKISEIFSCPIGRQRALAMSNWTVPKSLADSESPSWASGESILTQKYHQIMKQKER